MHAVQAAAGQMLCAVTAVVHTACGISSVGGGGRLGRSSLSGHQQEPSVASPCRETVHVLDGPC